MRCYFKYILFLASTVFLTIGSVNAQNGGFNIDVSRLAFKPGEKLTYRVSYSAAIFKTDVADIEITTTTEKVGDVDCYKVTGNGRTRPFYSAFFEMNDTYISWLDRATLRPIKMTSELKEGGYRYRQEFNFHWDIMVVSTMGHNIKRDRTYLKELPLKDGSYDALSLFFNVRSCDDFFRMKPGDKKNVLLVLEDTVRSIELRYIGPENKKVQEIGEFKTLKFACQLATSNDESFEDGSEFFIWISDDRNRIPIHLETPIRIGSVTAIISGSSGLKYPLDAMIKKK